MVRARTTIAVIAAAIGLAVATTATGQVQTTVSIDAMQSVTLTEDDATALGIGTGEVDFRSTDNPDVRSRLQLRASLVSIDGVSTNVLTVPRAEIRWRMYAADTYRMRFTVGRSRLSWGDGVLFNAADTINGGAPNVLDLTASTLRDETQWLSAGYFPLGRFGFFEPVVLLPGLDLSATSAPTTGTASTTVPGTSSVGTEGPSPAWHTAAGARTQYKLGGIKLEAGYLYRGDVERHRPSLALQGNLFLDWYLAAALRLPDPPDEETDISAGLLHSGTTRRGGTWSVRLEALYTQNGERGSVFPELTWSPSQLFTVFLRSVVTPIETWALLDPDEIESVSTFGFQWTPTTGLTLSVYTSAITSRDLAALTSTAPTGDAANGGAAVTRSPTVPEEETTPSSRATDPAATVSFGVTYTF